MQHRIKDMTTGLYMEVPTDAKTQCKIPAWTKTGTIWNSVEDMQGHLTGLSENGNEVSSLWEVEEVELRILSTYPAVIYTPKKKGGRR